MKGRRREGKREEGGKGGGAEGEWRVKGKKEGGKEGGREGGEKGDPLTVTQLLRGNLTAISSHTRKPKVAGEGQGGTGRVNAREENKEKSEHKRERGGKKEVERRVQRIKCVHFAHIKRLTYDGKDEGVSEIVVERQFHIALPQTQCSSCGHEGQEDVESWSRN